MTVPDRLRAADLRPLWTELHKRFSTGAAVSRVTLKNLDDDQRAALADLLGMDRYPPTTGPSPWPGWTRSCSNSPARTLGRRLRPSAARSATGRATAAKGNANGTPSGNGSPRTPWSPVSPHWFTGSTTSAAKGSSWAPCRTRAPFSNGR